MKQRHGLYLDPATGKKSRLYTIWEDMKHRCNNQKNARYHRYGGRGITVCNEWANDYSVFYHWAMTNGYNENLTIERDDVDGNYEPNNCSWATPLRQANNRATCKMITYNGITKSMADWARDLGAGKHLIRNRIKRGWSIDRAVTTPK